MSSRLLRAELERAGLLPLLELRERGQVPCGEAVERLLAEADLLAIGAAADLARRRECGDEARIYVPRAPEGEGQPVGAGDGPRGAALLRLVASLRLAGPIEGRIVIDFAAVGLELAEVALSFGATDLAGPIANRRGLLLFDKDDKKLKKQKEIAGMIERAGFRPEFVSVAPRPGGGDGGGALRPHVES